MFTQASICIRMYVHCIKCVCVCMYVYIHTCVCMHLHLYMMYMYDWCSISSFNGIIYQNFPGQQGHSTYLKCVELCLDANEAPLSSSLPLSFQEKVVFHLGAQQFGSWHPMAS